jgi:ABC-type hemin transport system substrate-binding protein
MLKPVLITSFLVLMQIVSVGQSVTSDTTKVKANKVKAVEVQEENQEEQVVEGIWAVSSYLGQKLADELGNRMNLGESNNPAARKPKKVTLVIGSLKFERMD